MPLPSGMISQFINKLVHLRRTQPEKHYMLVRLEARIVPGSPTSVFGPVAIGIGGG